VKIYLFKAVEIKKNNAEKWHKDKFVNEAIFKN